MVKFGASYATCLGINRCRISGNKDEGNPRDDGLIEAGAFQRG